MVSGRSFKALRKTASELLQRRDVDRAPGVLTVRQTVSGGEIVELDKTERRLRQVPLSPRALVAIDGVPPRLDSSYLIRLTGAASSISPTSDAVGGIRRSRHPEHAGRPGSMTCGRSSPRTRSQPTCRCSSWRDHGQERGDDRADLRDPARRCGGGYRTAVGRLRADARSVWAAIGPRGLMQ